MKAVVDIDAGVCGFSTRVIAASDDRQHVAWDITSGCEKIRGLAREIFSLGQVDSYEEISATGESRLLSLCRRTLKGCCAGCAVPIGLFKAMQVAAGLALPKDIHIKINTEKKGDFMSPELADNRQPDVRCIVREHYGKIAQQRGSCCASPSCCSPSPESVATAVGYSTEEITALPNGANMGLSCGNPTAIASLQPGEIVLDLGAGGGIDVFLAARKVGATGRAIGVDMTPEMIAKARENAIAFTMTTGLKNVEFRLGEIEHLPLPDASVDVVISNCVVNLSPDKPQVWREVARVLKPGGRVAISDLALLRPLPDNIRKSVNALVGCIAGAILATEIEQIVRAAGLIDITLIPKADYLDQMFKADDPLYRDIVLALPHGTRPGDFITSLLIKAKKRND